MTNDISAGRTSDIGQMALVLLSVLALADAIFNYFWTGNGIHGSEGALLVIVSTALMAIAGTLILFALLRGGWRTLFEVLIALDLLGTALAAYFLEAWILLTLVALAAIAWLVHMFRPASRVAAAQS